MIEHYFSSDLIEALVELIDMRVARALAERHDEEWLPIGPAAELLGCTPAALRERARRRTVPFSKYNGRLYFKRGELFREISRKRVA